MTRIHIVSLPHTLLTRDYDWCAYTAKVRRFVDMLLMSGDQPIVYGPDIADDIDPAADYVPIVTAADRLEWFGAEEWDTSRVFDHWDAEHVSWKQMNQRAAEEIRQRWQPGDILGLIGGGCQREIMDLLKDKAPLTVEWGIGYSGIIPGTHKVYESYAWAHHVAGFYRADDIQYFDDVIPNCFDINDFTFSSTPGDYLLYLGRPNPRKGLAVVQEIAARSALPVLIAGQPGPSIPNTQYVGVVTGKRKADLLAGARALLTPTSYLEPFGGVAVEAMLSGTPVIASDWGAFTETVVTGVTGYRCRMLHEFMDATEAVEDMNRDAVRAHAVARYTLPVGSCQYTEYLQRLGSLYADGWYTGVD